MLVWSVYEPATTGGLGFRGKAKEQAVTGSLEPSGLSCKDFFPPARTLSSAEETNTQPDQKIKYSTKWDKTPYVHYLNIRQ